MTKPSSVRAVALGRIAPSDLVTPAGRRAAYLADGRWDNRSLPDQLRRHAGARGDRTAVVAQEGALRRTYRELDRDVDRVAAHLVRLGVTSGDVVAVQLPNWYGTVVIGLAALRAGAILNPMVTIYRRHELQHMIDVARTRVLFTPGTYRGFDHAAMAAGLAQNFPFLAIVTVADPVAEPRGFDDWLAGLPDAIDIPPRPADEVSQLLFSSGTEAAPKAIMHTEQTAGFGVRTAARSLGVGADDIVWMPSPIGHSTGFNFGVRMAVDHGLTLVLQDRWDAQVAARLVTAESCTYTVAATTFLDDLVRHCAQEDSTLPTLRLFSSGGAPVPAELVSAAAERGMTVLRLYGSTEVLVATWNRPGAPARKLVETDGPPLDGVEVEVRDDLDHPVLGAPGEIVVRGPGCSVGFLGDPERTARTYDEDGWVRSGDLGVLDEDGYLTIVGRKKEIIIRGGMNVAPREVEALIEQLPGVRRVAVVGTPDERLGEVGCACIVLEPGATMTLADLVRQLKEIGLAAFKLPERLAIVSDLPSTPTGKVQKHRLLAAISTPDSPERALVHHLESSRP